MSYLVVVLLSLLWLGFFLPGLVQARRTSPLVSATTFQESIARISNGHAVTPAGTAAAARRRRKSRREIARQRDILSALSARFIASLAVAISFEGPIQWVVAPAALGLVGYVVALRRQAVSRRVPQLPAAKVAKAPEPVVVPSVKRREPAAESRELERIAG